MWPSELCRLTRVLQGPPTPSASDAGPAGSVSRDAAVTRERRRHEHAAPKLARALARRTRRASGPYGPTFALGRRMADSLQSHVLPPRLGFVGLGGMGSRMASRLMTAGYELTVYDRTRHRAQQLQQRGARLAESPRDLAASADIVLSSVTDDEALAEVMYGNWGALEGARSGAAIIDLSTVHPRTSIRLFEAGRATGIDVLDAPVSGSLPQAEQGQLVVFVGGDQAVFERCRSIVTVLGKAAFYMGPSGAGAVTKLCTNALLGIGLQALGEAIALGQRAGLPRERLLEALAETSVLSASQRSKFDNIKRDEYPPTFPLRLMSKDFSLILQQAYELSVAMPATAAAAQVAAVEHAREAALGIDEDCSAVVRSMLDWALPSSTASGIRHQASGTPTSEMPAAQ
jgi:3-hydroxyisobutyrate dehydrogenase